MKDINPAVIEEPAAPTFGERFHSFWMDPIKVDPVKADRMTSFPAVVGGITFLFGLMILFGLVFG